MHIHNIKSGTSSLSALSFLLAAGLVLAGLSIAQGQNENNNGQTGNANRPVVANANGNGNRNGNGNVSTATGNSNGGSGGGTTTTAPGGGQPTGTDGGQAATGANDPNALKVTKVEGKLALFNTIKVTVQNLQALLKEAGNDYSKLVLYLDGYPLKGIDVRQSAEANQLQFDIRQTDNDETKARWNSLFGRPNLPIPRTKPVSVSVGVEGKQPIQTDVKQYPLTVIDGRWYWAYVAGLIFVTFLLWRWARNSDLLRVAKRPAPDRPQRYSLGFCQMAFWFYVVAASYVFIWMVTSEYRVFPGEVLALLGISAATALGASLINTSGPGETTRALAPQDSEGWFSDITTDENGKVSFHRFQIVIWTVVLGIIFLFTIYNLLTMPKFPDTLLALMGISSGTYIGFKFPEKKEAEARALAARQAQNPTPGGGGTGGGAGTP
ncbi:MAG TPA: hypothetical protein VM911_13980 [Pyrinomonadaceae bacterium]|jgi:hypothetical protein|nr:hypothetical protein [Pyrinomonadaceae bacterium]